MERESLWATVRTVKVDKVNISIEEVRDDYKKNNGRVLKGHGLKTAGCIKVMDRLRRKLANKQ